MKPSHDKQRPFLIPKLNAPILLLLIVTFVLIDWFAMPWTVAALACPMRALRT